MSFLLPVGREIPGLAQKSDAAFFSSLEIILRAVVGVATKEVPLSARHFRFSSEPREIRLWLIERRFATLDFDLVIAELPTAAPIAYDRPSLFVATCFQDLK